MSVFPISRHAGFIGDLALKESGVPRESSRDYALGELEELIGNLKWQPAQK